MVSSHEQRRVAHQRRLAEMSGPLYDALGWSRDELGRRREQRLRALVEHVRRSSAWHTRRLAGIDPGDVTPATLHRIPPMTKADLMAHWDEIVAEPRLSLARCEQHLASLDAAPRYLDDEFHAVASGGSSGTRGVFAYGWDEWALLYAAGTRWMLHGLQALGRELPREAVSVSLTASAPTHSTAAARHTFAPATHHVPVTRPLAEIVQRVQRLDPAIIVAYTSIAHLLAVEALAGRLSIAPRWLWTTAEPLLPETARLIERAFGIAPVNMYGTSDVGLIGSGCGLAPGIHLNEDLLILEPVDAAGSPVAPGETASKFFATPLEHRTLPLIRYEISDEIRLLPDPCPCGCVFARLDDVQGRSDDLLRYGRGVIIHPHVLRSCLGAAAEVWEYQVRQTSDGALVLVRASEAVDLARLGARLEQALTEAGLSRPRVEVRRVDAIDRGGVGKLKRFVPLPERQ